MVGSSPGDKVAGKSHHKKLPAERGSEGGGDFRQQHGD